MLQRETPYLRVRRFLFVTSGVLAGAGTSYVAIDLSEPAILASGVARPRRHVRSGNVNSFVVGLTPAARRTASAAIEDGMTKIL